MKAFLVSMLMRVVASLLGSRELLESIKELVKEAARLDISGSAKKRHVEEKLTQVKGKALKVYKETSNTMINLAIEAAVVWMKGKARQ